MRFTDTEERNTGRYSLSRLDYILAGAGHLLLLVVGLITFSGNAESPAGGDDAIMVSMITAASASGVSQIEATGPAEIQEETEAVIHEETEDIQEETDIEEIVVEEHPENPVEEIPIENPLDETHADEQDFVSVSGDGISGTGAPGPGTYESRVFNAVRRGYRTSVEPDESYKVILTVNIDGTTSIEVVRKSGTSAFDRAVEDALSRAQIPPMPPGRSNPAIINIEFIGPEQ